MIKQHTGLHLSPYFSAAKLAWIMENVGEAKELAAAEKLCMGTMDSWLLYCLTKKEKFATDMSNASRTQLFHIHDLTWDKEICSYFGIPVTALPKVCSSNAEFGKTDVDEYLKEPIPVYAVIGDSHGALYGQGCIHHGMITTYGTGSSIMMNTGSDAIISKGGTVTSLAFAIDGKVSYVLEGNINYTGGVISWLKNDIELISSPDEAEKWVKKANPKDKTYLVPAFTGLGAPYWAEEATGTITGMTRLTGKAELIKAGVECIA